MWGRGWGNGLQLIWGMLGQGPTKLAAKCKFVGQFFVSFIFFISVYPFFPTLPPFFGEMARHDHNVVIWAVMFSYRVLTRILKNRSNQRTIGPVSLT